MSGLTPGPDALAPASDHEVIAMPRLEESRRCRRSARCYDAARLRFPDESVGSVQLVVHVDRDGRVDLAGPLELSPVERLDAELVHCVMEGLAELVFPPPSGVAVMVSPFSPDAGPAEAAREREPK